MKKTIVNSFAFIIGYLVISMSIMFLAYNFYDTFNKLQTKSPVLIFFMLLAQVVLAAVSASVAKFGIEVIEYALLPGISSFWSLKKGEVIQVVKIESNYPHDFITIKRCPFQDSTRTELVRTKYGLYTEQFCVAHAPLAVGFRYFYDGKKLQSVLPKK